MQQLDFQVEILIGEDESTDGTRQITQRLAAEHPGIIRLFLNNRSDVIHIMGRPTGRANLLHLMNEAKGKYIALCEGDDYWTDPLKLQKQVDFLEGHPLYSMCFHRAMLKIGNELEPHPIPTNVNLDEVQMVDLFETANFIATASVVYRNQLMPMPNWFAKIPFADLGLHLLNSRTGRMKCLDEFMAVYRINEQGSWSSLRKVEQQRSKLLFFKMIFPLLNPAEKKVLARKHDELIDSIAHIRYPYNPRRKRFYKIYLKYTFRLRT